MECRPQDENKSSALFCILKDIPKPQRESK